MSIVEFLSQPFWHTLGLTLVHFVWQGCVVAVVAGALVHGLRLRHGNARYTAYLLGFAAMIACPILTFNIVQTPSIAEPKGVTEVAATRVEDPAAYLPLPPRAYPSETSISSSVLSSASTEADPMPLRQRLSDRMHLSLPWILITWLVGVGLMSVRLLMGCMGVHRWRQNLEPLPDSLATRIAPLARRLGMKDFAAVFMTRSDIQAMAMGYLRPIVILPATMITRMPPEMLEAVIAHELAHIRRLDLWVILLQRIVETLLFYHPAVWWLSNRIRNEREFCCDELAVEATDERVTYASTLEQVARARVEAKQWLLAAGIARSDISVLGRVRHILGLEPSQRQGPFWLAGVMTLLLLGSLAIPVVITAAAQNEAEPSAQFILEKMLEHRSKVRNLQYVVNGHTSRFGSEVEQVLAKESRSRRERATPGKLTEATKERQSRIRNSTSPNMQCTVDKDGRFKIVLPMVTYDSSGNGLPDYERQVWAWNGIIGTEFIQRSGSMGNVTIKGPTENTLKGIAHPWLLFSVDLWRQLEETIAAGRQVDVTRRAGGAYRLVFDYKSSKIVADVDPSQGYSCALIETYHEHGEIKSRSTIEQKEVTEGIWFPVKVRREEYSPDGTVQSRSRFLSHQIVINDPAFDESYFDVDIPRGAPVRDYTRNSNVPETYRYGQQRKTPEEMARIGINFIAGKVIDESGSPIAGVSVETCSQRVAKEDGKFHWKVLGTPSDPISTVTDDHGRFAVELPEDGLYNLRFVSENHAAIIAYDVPHGKKDLTATLPEGAILRGRITRIEDGRAEPVSFAKVKIQQRDRDAYYYLGVSRDRETVTDSQGRFEFAHLRTKKRTPETQNSEQWQYYPRYWTFVYNEEERQVVFPGSLNTVDMDIVLSNGGIGSQVHTHGHSSRGRSRVPVMTRMLQKSLP
ncbi:MAG: M48 family metalloprotease [Planctomycetes bacterium]|nr:M48 family metalloprotease [Planctomycetota bacterium]